MHIALLEDDPLQLGLYKIFLESGGHTCDGFETSKAFSEALKRSRYDLLMIDWLLPDGRGDMVIQMVRKDMAWDVPIIVLSSNDDEGNVVLALRGGADDHIVKPPRPMAMLARVEALLRRTRANSPATVHLGIYDIDPQSRTFSLHGQVVELTQKEFDLAVHLFHNTGKLLSRVKLLEQVWGIHAEMDTRTVDTHVSRIRRKLHIEPDNGFKLTPIYGFGYRLERVEASRDSAASTS